MPAKILYLGTSAADFAILAKRVRPASTAQVTVGLVTRAYVGESSTPVLPPGTAGQQFDMVVYSPQIGTPEERETLLAALLY